jgi:hypothetical protein
VQAAARLLRSGAVLRAVIDMLPHSVFDLHHPIDTDLLPISSPAH